MTEKIIMFIGPTGCGKTSLVAQLTGYELKNPPESTIGIEIPKYMTLQLGYEELTFQCWELAENTDISKLDVRQADVVICVSGRVRKPDINVFKSRISALQSKNLNPKLILCVNKKDSKDWPVYGWDPVQVKDEINADALIYCSAKTGDGLDQLKHTIANLCKRKVEEAAQKDTQLPFSFRPGSSPSCCLI